MEHKMASYIVLGPDGKAVNVVEWDGVSDWNPGEGCTAKLMEDGDQFDHYCTCEVDKATGKVAITAAPAWMGATYRADLANTSPTEASPTDGMKVV